MNFIPANVLDLRQVEGGAEELVLLHVVPPQSPAQLVQLLHAQRGQLTWERAALQRLGSDYYLKKQKTNLDFFLFFFF